MWKNIQQKITRTSLEHVGDVEQETLKIFGAIFEITASSFARSQEFVGGYFQNVREYNELQSSLSTRLTPLSRDSQFVESCVAEEKDALQKQLACFVS